MKDARPIALVLGLLWVAWGLPSGNFGLLNGIITYTHEGGHLLCMPFMPRLITIAAGTGMQLLMPAAITASFYLRQDRFSAAITALWLAASLRQASVYAQDAIDQDRPLLFSGLSAAEELEQYGETEHDFINMLDILHLPLGLAHTISALLFLAAIATLAAALYLGLQATAKPPRRGP
jgi:hypothetical protein